MFDILIVILKVYLLRPGQDGESDQFRSRQGNSPETGDVRHASLLPMPLSLVKASHGSNDARLYRHTRFTYTRDPQPAGSTVPSAMSCVLPWC